MLANLKKKNKHFGGDSEGQALLFVVVAMTIALSVGINASVRTITSLSRTSRTDTASRALAAAEGGIERYLALSTTELEDTNSGNCAVGTFDNDANACLIEFDATTDVVVSQAFVTVERYEPDFYPFELESGQIKEVNLYDYNSDSYYPSSDIELCWSSVPPPATDPESDLMYIAYNNSGVQARGGLYGTNSPGAPDARGGFDGAGAGHDGYDNCATVDISNDIYGLRIRSMGGTSRVGVFPDGGARLPLQGYTIKSVGRIAQDTGVTATRTITIIRTLPYLPVSFDYALYSEGSIIK